MDELKQNFPGMENDVKQFLLNNNAVRNELFDRQRPTMHVSLKDAKAAEDIILKTAWKKDLLVNLSAPHNTDKEQTTRESDLAKINNAPVNISYPVESVKLAAHMKNKFENLTQALRDGKASQDVVESGHKMFKTYQQHMGEVEQRIGPGFSADDREALWTMTYQVLAEKQPALASVFQEYTNKNGMLQQIEQSTMTVISARPPKNFFTLGGAERMQVAAAMQNNKDIRVGFNNMLQFFNNAQAPAQGAE